MDAKLSNAISSIAGSTENTARKLEFRGQTGAGTFTKADSR
jgi:hypothetical protein